MPNNQERTLYGVLSTQQRNLNGNMPGETIFGIQGPTGPQGIPGVNPHIGANGNWYVGTTDTGIPATGPVGPVGEQGIPGMTPHIGDNGNWYIGSSDTGVPATGPIGPAGADGKMSFTDLTEEQKESLRGPEGPPPSVEEITEAVDAYMDSGNARFADTIQKKTGDVISVDNSAHTPLQGLRVFGKTIQNGTPSPDAPVALDSVGDDGSVTVKVGVSEADENAQILSISTPNGLPGIPVSSGGNYTDENGQQWVCDEVDFAKGKYIQRIGIADKNTYWSYYNNGSNDFAYVSPRNLGFSFSNFQVTINRMEILNLKCNCLRASSRGTTLYAGTFTISDYLYVKVEGLKTTAEYKAWMESVDFKLLYILENEKTVPLSDAELAQYSALHTNYPSTTIFNDEGADMEVKYYTPSTAVPMVYGAAQTGKFLSIDEHGCVVPVVPGFATMENIEALRQEILGGAW